MMMMMMVMMTDDGDDKKISFMISAKPCLSISTPDIKPIYQILLYGGYLSIAAVSYQ